MLRPERMSRVSVTGSQRVLDDVVETIHDLNLLDLTDYDGNWEGFDPGNPVEGAEEAAEKLVTVRSLKSILDIDEEDAGPTRIVTDEALEDELEAIRTQVNDLDDERDEIRDELRAVEERIDGLEPFADLGIDMDLLGGYDTLEVVVGEGDPEAVERALATADGVAAAEVYAEGSVLAAYAYTDDRSNVTDALVGVPFAAVEVPDDAEGSPEEYLSELEHRKQQLESKLTTVEGELEEVKLDVSGFLLAAEEKLAIEVQKREAPLSFATTENAFVAEGWIPTERFVDLAEGLQDTVGDHVEVEELERADYDEEGHPTAQEPAEGGHPGEPTAADGGQPVQADGGTAMSGGDPPVIQDNPGVVKPFESLTEVINRPKYGEFDPTVIVFLTFPAFFGFMIGDLGYGILYMLMGGLLYTRMDSDILRSLGGVALWAGGFTAIFGVLYGEFFGLHQLGEIVWGGNPPIHKGLQPYYSDYALAWLVLSLLAGILHLTIGWVFDFVQKLDHGFREAMGEAGSWLLMMFGLWAWIFAGAFGSAPSLLYGAESVFNGNPFPLGFTGLPEVAGLIGLAVFALGFVLLVTTEPVEGVEFLNVLVNVLSYTRLAAVLLAKAGMAFVVNLLFFGVYVTGAGEEAEWHYAIDHMPEVGAMAHGHEVTEIMFGGLLHSGIAGVLVGALVLVVGHVLVLVLGITSAGLQAVRLEYVEFFGKFYEGGGRQYSPFGYERLFTSED